MCIFHLLLKNNGDIFYLRFLNRYGDSSYCIFSINDYRQIKGIYSFTIQGNVTYIGRSHDPFKKRINQGYGHISPKNCYRDGRSTNCHLNSLIDHHHHEVKLFVYPMIDNTMIDYVERMLIRHYQPEWNIALKHDN